MEAQKWTEQSEIERIEERYRQADRIVNGLVTRFMRAACYREAVGTLLAEGWKHWHVLLATFSAVINRHCARAQLRELGMLTVMEQAMADPETLAALERADPTPAESLSRDVLVQALNANVAAYLKGLGHSLKTGRGYSPATLLELAERRYRYRELDVPHKCPLDAIGADAPGTAGA